MKKIYEIPTIEVIALKQDQKLLAGSNINMSSTEFDNDNALSREFEFEDF